MNQTQTKIDWFIIYYNCGFRAGVPPPDPKAMQQQAAGKRLQQQQAQVDEVCVSLLLLSLWFELTCLQSS